MLNTIKDKLVFLSIMSIIFVAMSVSFSYLIAVGSIKKIMQTDVSSVADAMQKHINYIAEIRPQAYKEDDFKAMLYSLKVGKSGYPFMMDEKGTLVVHPKDEGKNLAGQEHIDYIRTHKEGGIYEYRAVTTGQDKIVAYRYIPKWDLWIVPGVNKADYFDELKSTFLKWNLVFAVIVITALTVISTWITRSVTKPLKGMLRIFKAMKSDDATGGIRPNDSDSQDTRNLVCRLLENLLYRRRGEGVR